MAFSVSRQLEGQWIEVLVIEFVFDTEVIRDEGGGEGDDGEADMKTQTKPQEEICKRCVICGEFPICCPRSPPWI